MPEYRFTSSKAGKSGPHLSVVGTALSPDDCSCEPPRIKVLCIDDDANSLLLMERCLLQLTRYEAQITTAGSIHLAGFALASDDFDVALVDLDVHGESGVDLIASFSRSGERSCRFFLLATGRLTPEIEAAARSAGVYHCSSKDELNARTLGPLIHEALTGASPCRLDPSTAVAPAVSAKTTAKPSAIARPVLVMS